MAIDRMKRVTVLGQAVATQRLFRALYDLGMVQPVDASEFYPELREKFQRPETSTEEHDQNLSRIQLILHLIDVFFPIQKGFFEGLTPLPLVVDQTELEAAQRGFDLPSCFVAARDLDEAYKALVHQRSEILTKLNELAALADIPYPIGELTGTRHVRLLFGQVPLRNLESLRLGPEGMDRWECEVLASVGSHCRVVAAFLPEDEEIVRKFLLSREFEETALPRIAGKVSDRIVELNEDLAGIAERIERVRTKVHGLIVHRRSLEILKAFWESARKRALARTKSLCGKWTHVSIGYVREKDLPRLREGLRRDFPHLEIEAEDPSPEEDVPVSIDLPRFVKPIQLLVNMFGLPKYGTFDPSPFLMFNFFLFFGICFSDVAYGLLLILASLYLMSKTRKYEGLYNFAKVFLYSGFTTVVFGALLGSWFGDLYSPKYLGEGNILQVLAEKFMVMDPLEKPVVALVISLALGMLNQFYGIVAKIYGAIVARQWAVAIFDGGLWLVTLPGFVILVSLLFLKPPPAVLNAGIVMFLLGVVGLILTQGRGEKGIVGKIVTGVVSIYGILGSYGCTAFVGDTLSYCRLLALGLTTSIVSMSFNMMAGLVKPVPYAGIFLFVLILVIGHTFNFLISMLGAFIHSARLIFVEFFGRFYDGGAKRFSPLGFDSPAAIIRK